jgi:hypothetical protein
VGKFLFNAWLSLPLKGQSHLIGSDAAPNEDPTERTILPDPNLTYETLENMDFYTDSLELLMNMA